MRLFEMSLAELQATREALKKRNNARSIELLRAVDAWIERRKMEKGK